MKKLFFMLLVLFALYLGIQFAFNFFSTGDNNVYKIKDGNNNFEVTENSNFSNKNNIYAYVIKGESSTFRFQINKDFNKSNQVLKKIEYYKDSKNECILPIFKDDTIVVDMLCYDNNVLTYYYNIKGKNKSLDSFIKDINLYDQYQFVDNTKTEKIESLGVYTDNLIKDHYLSIQNYKGIYDISKNFNSVVYDISLFSKDIYNQKVSVFIDNYYVVIDYEKEHEFNKFIIVDLVRLDTNSITSDKAISLDSYIQGIVDDKIYLYDKDNKTQYEINISNNKIVSYTGNSLKYYKDGTWTTMTVAEANSGMTFTKEKIEYENKNYERIDKVGKNAGYYYMYKKVGNKYNAYCMSIQDPESIIYLFSTQNIDNIVYADNYIYFVNNNKVQVFNHSFGVKNIVQYNELQFNKNFSINVYSK